MVMFSRMLTYSKDNKLWKPKNHMGLKGLTILPKLSQFYDLYGECQCCIHITHGVQKTAHSSVTLLCHRTNTVQGEVMHNISGISWRFVVISRGSNAQYFWYILTFCGYFHKLTVCLCFCFFVVKAVSCLNHLALMISTVSNSQWWKAYDNHIFKQHTPGAIHVTRILH